MAETILVTGAAGYIGSHTTLALLEAGFDVVALDNLHNASTEAIHRVAHLAGRGPRWTLGDVRDAALLDRLMAEALPAAVVHFAGVKAVAEGEAKPLLYYDVNVVGSLRLAEACARHGVRRLLFSSSATVYDPAEPLPFREDSALGPASVYGRTKRAVEELLTGLAAADARWRIGVLRYFNPVGAHPSGLIGENPRDVPNNLMPLVTRVALGREPELVVFGTDWPTPDGTCVRDYVHVWDVAEAHVKAARRLLDRDGSFIANLGTGRGHSVLELIAAFERATGRAVARRNGARRRGDVAASFADPALAADLLDWRATRPLDAMCEDAWRWQAANPDGFARR
jgi:UDP-glucose 4-epimerase